MQTGREEILKTCDPIIEIWKMAQFSQKEVGLVFFQPFLSDFLGFDFLVDGSRYWIQRWRKREKMHKEFIFWTEFDQNWQVQLKNSFQFNWINSIWNPENPTQKQSVNWFLDLNKIFQSFVPG